MKKLTKGAVALGVGTALMLGGAGTFAYWNQSVNATAGTITAGDLKLENTGAGQWKDGKNNPIANIADYKVVPGDKLTYTQNLKATLVGDKIAANLSVEGGPQSEFTQATQSTVIKDTAAQKEVANPLRAGEHTVTAVTTFEFPSGVTDRVDATKKIDFSNVKYQLKQIPQDGLTQPTQP